MQICSRKCRHSKWSWNIYSNRLLLQFIENSVWMLPTKREYIKRTCDWVERCMKFLFSSLFFSYSNEVYCVFFGIFWCVYLFNRQSINHSMNRFFHINKSTHTHRFVVIVVFSQLLVLWARTSTFLCLTNTKLYGQSTNLHLVSLHSKWSHGNRHAQPIPLFDTTNNNNNKKNNKI